MREIEGTQIVREREERERRVREEEFVSPFRSNAI